MNNEEIKEAIETLERNYPFDRYVQLKKAVDVAIEALHTVNSPIRTMMRLGEFQADAIMQSGKDTDVPDDDSISRQDAIDMIYGCEDEFGKDVVFRLADYIRQLPSVKSKQLQVLANVLDGCPLTQPCDRLWKPEGWCKEHCKPGQQEPDAECWLKYAEVMASEQKDNSEVES